MAYTDTSLTDERNCRSCGHVKLDLCPCGCCVADEEAAFAETCDDLGAEALRDGDFAAAEWWWDAADYHAEPSEGTLTARMLLLNAALSRQESEL